ncbi:MAG: hypothetical protein ABI876_07810, partial [Bacteroidota bacterium]
MTMLFVDHAPATRAKDNVRQEPAEWHRSNVFRSSAIHSGRSPVSSIKQFNSLRRDYGGMPTNGFRRGPEPGLLPTLRMYIMRSNLFMTLTV